MAKADEFRWAAGVVTSESEQIREVAERLLDERENVGIEGGMIATMVDKMISEIVELIGSIGDVCCDISEELERRACCCDDYTKELWEWLQDKIAYEELVRNGATPFIPLRPRPEPCCFWCEASFSC